MGSSILGSVRCDHHLLEEDLLFPDERCFSFKFFPTVRLPLQKILAIKMLRDIAQSEKRQLDLSVKGVGLQGRHDTALFSREQADLDILFKVVHQAAGGALRNASVWRKLNMEHITFMYIFANKLYWTLWISSLECIRSGARVMLDIAG